MPKARISGNRWVDISEEKANKLRAWKGDKSIPGSRMVDLDNGIEIALSGVQEINMSNDDPVKQDEFDPVRDRKYLEGFLVSLELVGPELAPIARFEKYCREKGYLTEQGGVNEAFFKEYGHEREKFKAALKLEDWKRGVADAQEEAFFGADLTPKHADDRQLKQIIIGLDRFIDGHPTASDSAKEIRKNLVRRITTT